ncbi:MAG: HAMP domain-containing sensor histidine kinase [Pseudomonadota bacterium]
MEKNKSYRNSSTFFIALISAVILLIVFSVLSFFLYIVSTSDFIGQAKRAIQSDAQQILRLHDAEGIDALVSLIEKRMQRGSDQIYLLLNDKDEKIIGMLDVWPDDLNGKQAGLRSETFFGMLQHDILDEHIDASWLRPPFDDSQFHTIFSKIVWIEDGNKLLIGRSLTDVERFRDLIGELSSLALIVLAIIVGINFAISIFVVRRVNRIASNARYVTETGDLTARIESTKGWDDLSYLARTINSMLDYIERLVNNVKQVTDNIAHDLRSPLTRLQNKIETLEKNRPLTEDEKLELKSYTETLLSMFSALLRISEIESGKHVFEIKAFNVNRLIEDVVEFFEPVAQDKNIELNYSAENVEFPLDRDLIFQAVLNIMENAIKFTPSEGKIEVTAQILSSGTLELAFSDTGPGVSDDDKPKILKRFYRTETSRTTPGNGLGLSMVKAIVDFHGGDIKLEDNNPGLCLKIHLPAS